MLTYLIIAHDNTPAVKIAENDDTAEVIPNTGLIVRNFARNSTVSVWTNSSSATFKVGEEILLPKLKIFLR